MGGTVSVPSDFKISPRKEGWDAERARAMPPRVDRRRLHHRDPCVLRCGPLFRPASEILHKRSQRQQGKIAKWAKPSSKEIGGMASVLSHFSSRFGTLKPNLVLDESNFFCIRTSIIGWFCFSIILSMWRGR